jgi:hypothetical protein
MNYNTYINKLNEVIQKSHLENGYSHIIYQIFDIILDDSKFSIVDTSCLKRTQDKSLAPKNVIAVPDFVITRKEFCFTNIQKNEKDILGCIEVKYIDNDVKNPTRLLDKDEKIGYIGIYNKVIYTNGWIWRYYTSENEYREINFIENPSNKTYGELLSLLCSIEWEESIPRT